MIIYRENPFFENFIKVTNEPLLHVLVTEWCARRVTRWGMSHPVVQAFSPRFPFYFPHQGVGGSFPSGLKSLPESPSLTQLPALLRGWIEFLGYSQECLLKVVCCQSPAQWSFMKWDSTSSGFSVMGEMMYEQLRHVIKWSQGVSLPYFHPWRKKAMSSSFSCICIGFH